MTLFFLGLAAGLILGFVLGLVLGLWAWEAILKAPPEEEDGWLL